METHGVASGGWAAGGEIFAKTAKTPPLQSGVARMPLRSKCRPIAAAMRIPCTPHATHLWGPIIFITTRRTASLPSHSPFPLMPMWSQMVVGGIRRNGIPAHANCRGGVFATRRFPRPPPPPHRHAYTMHPACHPPMWTYGFYNDAARRVATVFEKFELRDLKLFTFKKRQYHKRLTPYGPFAAVSFWNTAV